MEEQRNVFKRVSSALGPAKEEESSAQSPSGSEERSSSVSPKVPKSKRCSCVNRPLAILTLIVLIIVIVAFYYRQPTDYFHPVGSADIGGVWCDVSQEQIACPKCSGHSKVHLIEEKIENPALITDALHKWKHFHFDHWNFQMSLREFPDGSRVYFGLLTFDSKYVNVIALKFLMESNANGYVFFSHFELPVDKPAKNTAGVLEYVETSASEMKALFSEDWTFLQVIDTSFTFRIERGSTGGFIRHKSCTGDGCEGKRFDGSSRLEETFQPLEKKQAFFLFSEKPVEKIEVRFRKRCYVVDKRYVQFCPDGQTSLTRCKRVGQGLMKNFRSLMS